LIRYYAMREKAGWSLSKDGVSFRSVFESSIYRDKLTPVAKKGIHIRALGLFLTRRCNLRCIYCCIQVGQDPSDKLTFTEIQSAIRQAREGGAKRLVIAGEGEPLLDENLFPIIDFTTGLGMKVRIFTNGLSIDRLTAKHLFRSGVSLAIKVHALDASTYDRLAGKRNAGEWVGYPRMPRGMEKVIIPRNLKYLLEEGYLRSRRLPWEESLLQIETVITPQNIDQLPDLARCCKEWDADFMVETVIPAGNAIGKLSELSVTQERQKALMRELRKILGWTLGLRQKIRCTFETNPFLDVSGNIRHCFGLAAEIGNIRDIPLMELHRREMAIRVERGLLSAPFSFSNNGFRDCATRKSLDVTNNPQ
jgi:MoaA/NifB/PqqE/SkfB family radical SAM enzyme